MPTVGLYGRSSFAVADTTIASNIGFGLDRPHNNFSISYFKQ